MMKTVSHLLSYEELKPQQLAIGCVIWLHGLGADGYDFVPIVRELHLPDTLPLKFIFPHAPEMPVTINQGYVMRAWYDIVAPSIDQHADQTGIQQSQQQIIQLIEQQEQNGMAAEKIILAGFSQGAVMALMTGLNYPKRLAGLIGLSGYLPSPDLTLKNAHPANANTPIFLAHGKEDSVVPFVLGERVHHALQRHHYPVTWRAYEMPHSVCSEEINDISQWLQAISF